MPRWSIYPLNSDSAGSAATRSGSESMCILCSTLSRQDKKRLLGFSRTLLGEPSLRLVGILTHNFAPTSGCNVFFRQLCSVCFHISMLVSPRFSSPLQHVFPLLFALEWSTSSLRSYYQGIVRSATINRSINQSMFYTYTVLGSKPFQQSRFLIEVCSLVTLFS